MKHGAILVVLDIDEDEHKLLDSSVRTEELMDLLRRIIGKDARTDELHSLAQIEQDVRVWSNSADYNEAWIAEIRLDARRLYDALGGA